MGQIGHDVALWILRALAAGATCAIAKLTVISEPQHFAHEWADAWNRRDIEAVLRGFDETAAFTSPVARQIGFAHDGVVKGKQALRRYWTAALELNRELHFEVTAVYCGVDTLVIAYRNQLGENRAEVLTFEDGLVIQGHGMFGVS